MTRHLLVMGLIALGLGWLAAQAPAKDQGPKDGGYTIDMPGEGASASYKVKTPLGDIEVKLYQFVTKTDPPLTYQVTSNDYPEESLKTTTPEKRLEICRMGVVMNTKGKLLDDKDRKLGANPGRELLVELPEKGNFVRMRIYLVKNRLYQVTLGGSKEKVTDEDATKFLDSFKLTAN